MTARLPSAELLGHSASGPAYVYDLDEVRAAYRELRGTLPEPSDIYYSLKANPHPALAAELRRLGCRAEITSAGELRSALNAGFAADGCLYTGPAKQPAEVSYALGHGVRHFSVDSPSQLRLVSDAAGEIGTPVRVLIRVNPDQPPEGTGLAMTGEPSQFGADASWVLSQPQDFASTRWCDVQGFHLFTGTNIPDRGDLLATLESTIALAAKLTAAQAEPPALIDLGGGFGHPFARTGDRPRFTGIREDLSGVLDECLPGWRQRQPLIAFESGRYLVGAAGTLLCTVRDVKKSKGRTFVLLDSGIHHLGGMSGLRRVPRINPALAPAAGAGSQAGPSDHPAAGAPPGTGTSTETSTGPSTETSTDFGTEPSTEPDCDIVGPLCTPLDSWARGVTLPHTHRPGDVVAVPNVGAYGLTGSLVAFLSHDPPAEIITDGGQPREISRLVLHRERRQLHS